MVGPVDYTATGLGERAEARVADFMRRVYAWMCVGLLVTAAVAYLTAATPPLVQLLASNRLGFWGIVIAELALVWDTTARNAGPAPATAGPPCPAISALLVGLPGTPRARAGLAAGGQSRQTVLEESMRTLGEGCRALGGVASFATLTVGLGLE